MSAIRRNVGKPRRAVHPGCSVAHFCHSERNARPSATSSGCTVKTNVADFVVWRALSKSALNPLAASGGSIAALPAGFSEEIVVGAHRDP
jgi:hypothetical protein